MKPDRSSEPGLTGSRSRMGNLSGQDEHIGACSSKNIDINFAEAQHSQFPERTYFT